MERFNRVALVLTVLLLPWLTPLPGRAQPPVPSPTGSALEVQAPTTQAAPTPPSTTLAPPTRAMEPPSARPPAGVSEQETFPQRLTLPAKPSRKDPLEIPPPAGGEVLQLQLPPLEPGDLRFPINLATAMRLADARPLIIAAAAASAWVAEAKLQQAKTLWMPDLNLGFVFYRHDGPGPDTLRGLSIPIGTNAVGQYSSASFGRALNQDFNMFYGGGALFYMQYFTDVIFEPLAARQALNSKRWDIQTAKNNALLMTANAYFNVHKWRGTYTGSLDVVQKGRNLVTQLNDMTKDLIKSFEVDRARNFLADLEQQALIARQQWRRASADLTQVLRLDPRAVVEPLEHDHLQITLIDPSRALDDLIPIGLTNRPELAGQQAMVQAAMTRIRQEKLRAVLPVGQLNGFQTPYEQLQVGVLGLGNGGKMNLWNPRDDISPQLMWQLDSLGFGNAAMVKWRRGEASVATVQLFKAQDMVAADVTRAQARLQSAAARVFQAERELRGALTNYKGVVEGLSQTKRFGNVLRLVFRPQEAVFSLKLLALAFNDYFATVAQYNQAQFQLFHDLGYPAREISFARRPGEVLDINTTRPTYLPAVGTGAPPAPR